MKKVRLIFGPGGVSERSQKRDSLAGIRRVRQARLDCMELEWVRRVSMGEETARQVNALAKELGVSLSVHAPYYINLNAADSTILEASKERLISAAHLGALCGATSAAFHPGFYSGSTPLKSYRKIRKHLDEVRRRLTSMGDAITLRPETSGRPSQFGTLEEIISLSGELPNVAPCLDFAHLHAVNNEINTLEQFSAILEFVGRRLGRDALADLHIHVSGIRYGQKGELEHLNLAESDLNYGALLSALKSHSVGGRVICESPRREADALLLKREYDTLRG